MTDYSILEKIALASVGLLTSSRKDWEKTVDRAIRRGETKGEEEARQDGGVARKGLLNRDFAAAFAGEIEKALSCLGMATASDFEALLDRIDRVEQALEQKPRRARRVRRAAGRRRAKAEPPAPPADVQRPETAAPEPTQVAETDKTARTTAGDPSAPQETGSEKAPGEVEREVPPTEAHQEDVGSLPH